MVMATTQLLNRVCVPSIFLVALLVTPVFALKDLHSTQDNKHQFAIHDDGELAEMEESSDDKLGESRRRRTRRRTINIEFGGNVRSTGGDGDLWRPELVKSLQCTSLTDCSECTTKNACWHGLEASSDGQLEISVTSSMANQYKYYGVEVFLACPSSGGVLELGIKELPNNAKMYFYVDGVLKKTLTSTGQTDLQDFLSNFKGIARLILEVNTNSLWTQYARLEFDARNVDAITNDCMDMKECLNTLGTGADAAFTFRNSNLMQSQCLEGNTGSFSSAELTACNNWVACLDSKSDGTKAALAAYLRVATSGASLLQKDQEAALVKEHAKSGTTACVDPATDDPEALQCNCYDVAMASCQTGESEEDCLNRFICGHADVCTSWKTGRCAGYLLQQNASSEGTQKKKMMSRRQQAKAKEEELKEISKQSLDNSLGAKCID